MSKGDMAVVLEKFNFTYGDTIKGRATLKLKKPQDGRGVFVGIKAEKKTTQHTSNGTQTRWETVFEFQEPKDVERRYDATQYDYDFELKVPQSQDGKAPEGWVGNAAQALQFLSGRSSSVKWYVFAKIDMSGRDVSKKVQINVG